MRYEYIKIIAFNYNIKLLDCFEKNCVLIVDNYLKNNNNVFTICFIGMCTIRLHYSGDWPIFFSRFVIITYIRY